MLQKNAVADAVRDLIAPYVATLGLAVWGVELASAGHRQLVRLYLDLAADTPRTPERLGVTIDECARVSRHLGALLEVEEIFHNPYVLEVSSPGLSRRFFERPDPATPPTSPATPVDPEPPHGRSPEGESRG